MKKQLSIIIIIVLTLNFLVLVTMDENIRGKLIRMSKKIIHAFYTPEASQTEEWYVCPMHPFYKRKQLGECGICGMSLVKQSELGEREEGVVMLSPKQIQLGGIKTTRVQTRILEKIIDTYGKVDYDERKVKYVTAWIGGRVDKLYVNFTGDVVRKGAPLLSIYSPELISTQEELLQVLRTHDKVKGSKFPEVIKGAEDLVMSSKHRLLRWGLANKQIEELEKTGKVSDHITIYAPVSGVVIKKDIYEGMYVKEGAQLYVIASLSEVWLYADIYEYEIPFVKVGLEVEITTRAFPGEIFKGRIQFIDPFMNPKTRTVRIRCSIPNPGYRLKPDMYARAIIKVPLGEKTLSIPEEAVLHSGERDIVFVDLGGGRYEPRLVTLGNKIGKFYEVKQQIHEGEYVVTSSNFLLSSESQLQGVLAKLEEFPAEVAWEKEEHAKMAQMKTIHATQAHIELIDHYLNIWDELSQDSFQKAPQEVDEIVKTVDGLLSQKMKNPTFRKILEEIKKQAIALDRNNLESFRKGFARLSNPVIQYTKLLHMPEKPLFVYYCSMFPGYWIQNQEGVRNPYYGSSMLTCGQLVSVK